MPLSKKRNKEGKKRRRDRGAAPATAPATEPSGGGGFLTRMRGGIRTVAGTGAPKKESLVSKILTWAIVAAAAYFVARRFGIIR